jgi:hypothetical protein
LIAIEVKGEPRERNQAIIAGGSRPVYVRHDLT